MKTVGDQDATQRLYVAAYRTEDILRQMSESGRLAIGVLQEMNRSMRALRCKLYAIRIQKWHRRHSR